MSAGLIDRRFGPWYRTTVSDPSVCAAIWSSQLDITDSGHTMSVVRGPNSLGTLEVVPCASCAPTITAPTASESAFAFAAFLPLPVFAFFAGGAASAPVRSIALPDGCAGGASSSVSIAAPGRFVAISAMTCRVFPRPMSSARIPPRHAAGRVAVLCPTSTFSNSDVFPSYVQNGGSALAFSFSTSHVKPLCWCGNRRVVKIALGRTTFAVSAFFSASRRSNSALSASSRSFSVMRRTRAANAPSSSSRSTSAARHVAGSGQNMGLPPEPPQNAPRLSCRRRSASGLFSGAPKQNAVTGCWYLFVTPVMETATTFRTMPRSISGASTAACVRETKPTCSWLWLSTRMALPSYGFRGSRTNDSCSFRETMPE